MNYNPDPHDRQEARLAGSDYARKEWFFVTICTHDRKHLFGDVVDGKMELNAFGRIAREEWLHTRRLGENVRLDAFVVMPNHVHGILGVACGESNHIGSDEESVRGEGRTTLHHGPTSHLSTSVDRIERQSGRSMSASLSTIVGSYKAAVTRRLNRIWNSSGSTVWQPRYHDRVIRTRTEHEAMRWYIRHNPARWEEDYLYT